jgi:hypothetical protein
MPEALFLTLVAVTAYTVGFRAGMRHAIDQMVVKAHSRRKDR